MRGQIPLGTGTAAVARRQGKRRSKRSTADLHGKVAERVRAETGDGTGNEVRRGLDAPDVQRVTTAIGRGLRPHTAEVGRETLGTAWSPPTPNTIRRQVGRIHGHGARRRSLLRTR